MNAQHNIQIGDPSRHGEAFLRYSRDWYDQGLFTDCRLVLRHWVTECHRIVLSAHSPVLRDLLLAGYTEIIVEDIQFDVLERIVLFMYDGSLFCNISEIHKFIEAAITFDMTDLLNALCNKVEDAVTPCNVISWRTFAHRLSVKIPLIFNICDSMIKEQFSEVIQHKKFLTLPVDEMVNIFLLCKPAADSIGPDLLLKAAVSWMKEHPHDVDKCRQLWHCIQLDDCSKSTLRSAKAIDGTPQELINKAIGKWDESLQQNILAFAFDDEFAIMNEDGELKDNKKITIECFSSYICAMANGFVVIVEDEYNNHDDTEWKCRLLTYTLPKFKKTEVSTDHLKPRGLDLYSVHNNKLYLIPLGNQKYIECFNFENRLWSRIPNPRHTPCSAWNAASIGEDVYFINGEQHLLRLRGGEFTEISTEHISKAELSERISHAHGTRYFVITAVGVSLYIFVTYSIVNILRTRRESYRFTKVYVYNTHEEQSGWMSIDGKFLCAPWPKVRPLCLKRPGSILIKCVVHNGLCEFDVNTGVLESSKFPCAAGFRQALLVDRQQIENSPCREDDDALVPSTTYI